MVIKSLTLQALTVCAVLAACDDGPIYPTQAPVATDGRVVKMTAQLDTAAGHWPSGYNLVLAGFADEESEVASIVKNLPASRDGLVDVVLSGIPRDVTSVSLCITGRLRNRLYTLATIPCPDTRDTVRMELGRRDLSMAGVLRSELFDQRCTGCHAEGGAFGLNLTKSAFVGRPSRGDAEVMIVEPGHSDRSLLYMMLTNDSVSQAWSRKAGFDHTGGVSSFSPTLLDLLREWIDAM